MLPKYKRTIGIWKRTHGLQLGIWKRTHGLQLCTKDRPTQRTMLNGSQIPKSIVVIAMNAPSAGMCQTFCKQYLLWGPTAGNWKFIHLKKNVNEEYFYAISLGTRDDQFEVPDIHFHDHCWKCIFCHLRLLCWLCRSWLLCRRIYFWSKSLLMRRL